MSHLGELIQSYQDQHGTSDRQLGLRIGVSGTVIGRWKRGAYVELPGRSLLEALADQIGVPYRRVVDAALEDTYFGQESSNGAPIAARRNKKRPPGGPRPQSAD